jgi:tripartite-type tricarboxylate transporter receptor subunit TctC
LGGLLQHCITLFARQRLAFSQVSGNRFGHDRSIDSNIRVTRGRNSANIGGKGCREIPVKTEWQRMRTMSACGAVATNSLVRLCLAGLVLAVGVSHAGAQDYPNRTVTLVVPLAPGGANDILARLVAQKLERKFGKPFIVENRPQGSGIPAALAVVRGPADGYTLLAASSTVLALNVTVRKNMPYDPRKDLTPLAMTARSPFVLVVNPALPVHSVDDLVKLARAKPGQLSFGAPGPATFHRLMTELFKSMFGLDLIYVPYKGSVPAISDLAGGHISFMFSEIPPALAMIQAGKLRALGVTTAQRVPALSDVPPLAEAGIPGFDSSAWHTIAAPSGVPRDIAEKLAAAIREGMTDPAVAEMLAREGAMPVVSPPRDELRRFVDSETVRWGKVIEQAGLAGSE